MVCMLTQATHVTLPPTLEAAVVEVVAEAVVVVVIIHLVTMHRPLVTDTRSRDLLVTVVAVMAGVVHTDHLLVLTLDPDRMYLVAVMGIEMITTANASP